MATPDATAQFADFGTGASSDSDVSAASLRTFYIARRREPSPPIMYRRKPTAAPDPIPVMKPSLEHGAWWTLRISSLFIVLNASPTVARLFGSTPSGNGTDFSDTSANRSMAAACAFWDCSSPAEPGVGFGVDWLGDDGEEDILRLELVANCGVGGVKCPSDVDGIIDFSRYILHYPGTDLKWSVRLHG